MIALFLREGESMAYSRIVGQNIQLVLQQKGISLEQLAQQLDYSLIDVHRIIDGVLLIDGNDIKEFAKILKVELSELVDQRDETEYRGLLHCMGEYHDAKNKDKILDYMDMYIGIEESMN